MAYQSNCGRGSRSRSGSHNGNRDERRRYGALNAIGGFSRDPRYMIIGENSSSNDPIYRGPCPPNPDGTDLENVYGFFYHEGELTVNESTPSVTTPDGAVYRRVELNATALMSDEGLVKERTRVLILDPGIYYLSYNFNVPESAQVNATFSLLYNRERIPGTSVSVQKDESDAGMSVSGHALIEVDANGAEIILGSTGFFDLTPETFENIASLIIFSIA
ncbi:MAG: hypothetical protein IKJ65_11230 [Clostridia bacterium]|nr:hypothetical protein [Clostridia bacterium]